MKKLFLLPLALIMVLGLTACGGDTAVTLVDVTSDLGISLKIPSDLTLQENLSYVNTETGDSVVLGVSEVGETPLSGWTEENILATFQSKYEDVAVQSFENGTQINGKEALESTVTLKTPKGNSLTMALVMVTDGTKNYIVSFSYGTDKTDSSIAINLQACIDSITITAA